MIEKGKTNFEYDILTLGRRERGREGREGRGKGGEGEREGREEERGEREGRGREESGEVEVRQWLDNNVDVSTLRGLHLYLYQKDVHHSERDIEGEY